MNAADRWMRWSATATVAGVAAVAGWVPYTHCLTVVRLADETEAVAFAYPVTVDGVAYASSMVLLAAARRNQKPPALAWLALGAGISATLACNVYSMSSHGVLGGLGGALPAVALVLSYELLMHLVRGSTGAPRTPVTRASTRAVPSRAANGHDPDLVRFRPYIEKGQVPGIKVIKSTLHVGQARAREVQEKVRTLMEAR
jgi:Protein of unknown function (DUF2637)